MNETNLRHDNITFSVIIPTYNRIEILKKTIVSVQKQTIKNIEILVCDDGSTDKTCEIVTNISKKDSRVKYINCGHNGRPAIPRNKGISCAKGTWLAFLDDDDVWNPIKLEVQLRYLEKFRVKACCSNAYIIKDGVNQGELYFNNIDSRFYSFRDFINVNPVICSSMVINHSLVKECKGFPVDVEMKAIEDYALWYRVVGYSKILYLNFPLVGYSVCSIDSIRLKKNISFQEQKDIIEKDFSKWIDNKSVYLKKYYRDERWFALLCGFLRRLALRFYPIKNIFRKIISRLHYE